MAVARLQQLLSKAKSAVEPTMKVATKEAAKQYETVMSQNSQYVVKDPAQADKLFKQWFFTKMSRIPVGLEECQREAHVLKGKWANVKDLPMTEVATYVGFAAEVYAWFCIGEIVGRGGSLTGYSI